MKIDSTLITRRDGQSEPDWGDEILRRIANAISGVRFGSVEVVIQDSRVVQIERKEKFRFDKNSRGQPQIFWEEPRTGEGSGHHDRAVNSNREPTGHPEVPKTTRDF